MKETTLAHIAQVVRGSLRSLAPKPENRRINQLSIDSRTMVNTERGLFVALRGERHNGHDYIDSLYHRGLRNFLVSEEINSNNYPEAAFLEVANTLSALQDLAAAHRAKHSCPVLAITGSNGKTIIKEWLYSLLHTELNTIRSPRSYNSQVGVPLSVFNMREEHQLAIIEAGISKAGEMNALQHIIAPNYGIISNIGEAHQANFANRKQKIDEKLKLFDTCQQVIYCADHSELASAIEAKFAPQKHYSWSAHHKKGASLQLHYEQQHTHTLIHYQTSKAAGSVRIPFVGQASLENASHALAFILSRGWMKPTVQSAFEHLQPVAMRLEISSGINHCQLINDYYNSDFNSLEIALQFQANHASSSKQQAALIISDMEQAECTDQQLAKRLSKLLRPYQLSKLVLIGTRLSAHHSCFPTQAECYHSTDEFLAQFQSSNYRNLNILLKGARSFQFERIAAVLQKKYHQTQLEVNLHAMVENLNYYKSLLQPKVKTMVMVKAFSYGTGSVEVAKALSYQQVDYLAVAVADEGVELRQAGVETPIIVMNPEHHSFELMMEHRLEPNIYSLPLFRSFQQAAQRLAVHQYPIHLKLETGMHRLGFSEEEELQEALQLLLADDSLRILSCFSHLAVSDNPQEDQYTHQQHDRFLALSNIVQQAQPQAMRHLLNSAGIERFPNYQHDMVRLGIGLYAGPQFAPIETAQENLVVARWTSLVSQVKTVAAGSSIGYGRVGQAVHDMQIAVIPVGYADGFDRRLSNGIGKVWIEGKEYPVVGNICMDMCMIDITGASISPGTPVELMGEHISLQQLAQQIGTISYEVLTGISQRVRRVYVQE